jgi:predicted 3-demethylubiquinone-9 3-methyltransferase (glyoxalase superfamily)
MALKHKITPFLWFDANAEEAANHYVSIFKDSKILKVTRMGSGHDAKVLTVSFELEGLEFVALNGGPQFKFTEAVSFVVHCESQEEVDTYWSKLTSGGGTEGQCGWLKDRFGLSWQVVPTAFLRMSQDPDPAKAGRVMEAMMKMKKFDIARLEQAYRGA